MINDANNNILCTAMGVTLLNTYKKSYHISCFSHSYDRKKKKREKRREKKHNKTQFDGRRDYFVLHFEVIKFEMMLQAEK